MADNAGVKARCIRRLEGLKANRQSFERDARQISLLAMPSRSRFLATDTNKGRRPNQSLNNSHAVFAFGTLQGGMTSGLSSESRPWFGLTVFDDELKDHPEVKDYLGECEKRMYSFIAQTNLYGVLKTGYLELGGFGTEAGILMEHRKAGMVGHALTFGEYWLGLNDEMVPAALYRECPMTAAQAVPMFGYDKVSPRVQTLYDNSKDEQVTFYHAIEENDDCCEGMLGWRGKPWRSVYWEDGSNSENEVNQMQGFAEKPFWAPRWDTTGNDAYGQGPGHTALPDIKELQMQTKRKAEVTDLMVWPEMVTTSKTKLKRQPRSVVNVAEVDARAAVHIPYQVPPMALEFVMKDIERLEDKINQATHADLFLAITNMQGMQPRNVEEIAARNEEKLSLLGPVIERVNNEKLRVVIDRIFGIMQRANMFPPAPQIMAKSPDIKIEFVSILTQMQRMVGLSQIERGFGFISQLSAIYPEARFKLDPMEAIDEYAERAGMPPRLIRTNEEAQGDGDQEKQAQQAAAVAQQAPNISKPFKDMTDAAAVASQIPGGGVPPVESLVPVVPR